MRIFLVHKKGSLDSPRVLIAADARHACDMIGARVEECHVKDITRRRTTWSKNIPIEDVGAKHASPSEEVSDEATLLGLPTPRPHPGD